MTAYDIEPRCVELAAAALEGTRLADSPQQRDRLVEELTLAILETVKRWVRVEHHNRELVPDDHARRARRDATEIPRRLR
jgi:hypothetical protein